MRLRVGCPDWWPRLSLALGDHAEPHCTTALSLAQEVGDARLAGWVRGTQAQSALYAGDPREAVAFAQAGKQVAPTGSAAWSGAVHTKPAPARGLAIAEARRSPWTLRSMLGMRCHSPWSGAFTR
jgi:hypothetical protein